MFPITTIQKVNKQRRPHRVTDR